MVPREKLNGLVKEWRNSCNPCAEQCAEQLEAALKEMREALVNKYGLDPNESNLHKQIVERSSAASVKQVAKQFVREHKPLWTKSSIPPRYQPEDLEAAYLAGHAQGAAEGNNEIIALREKVEEFNALLNTPEIEDFDKAVPLEAAHQIMRWGAEHDEGKNPEDWFWLVGYLAGKALAASRAGDLIKAKHHCISTSAVLRNWHAQLRSGISVMRPGISAEKSSAILDAPPKVPHEK